MAPGIQELRKHVRTLSKCRKCSGVVGPVVVGEPVNSRVMLVGQAPGKWEGKLGKPFAWTAGKTLFSWFNSIGLTEAEARTGIYFAAVCRCFPGKSKGGGDRVPSREEAERCRLWLDRELKLLQPALVIPVGKLAIGLFLPSEELKRQIGKKFSIKSSAGCFDVIPLPHPSGASPWHRTEPGKTLLTQALKLIKKHPSFRALR